MVAIIWPSKVFRPYLFSRPSEVLSNPRPLQCFYCMSGLIQTQHLHIPFELLFRFLRVPPSGKNFGKLLCFQQVFTRDLSSFGGGRQVQHPSDGFLVYLALLMHGAFYYLHFMHVMTEISVTSHNLVEKSCRLSVCFFLPPFAS